MWDNPFTDVKAADWFYESVKYVFENKLMNGTSSDSFEPQTSVSRAMFVTILYRLADEPAVSASNVFHDVAAGQWYSDAVIWASANGVVLGYGDTFGVNDNVTREQMATILFRYAAVSGEDINPAATLDKYSDLDRISVWAAPAMEWAVAKGIISGRSATELAPQGAATRAEAATILRRFIDDSG
jgi:hypothetical protein